MKRPCQWLGWSALLAAGCGLIGCQTTATNTVRLVEFVETRNGIQHRITAAPVDVGAVERSADAQAIRQVTDLAPDQSVGSFCFSPDRQTLVLEIREQMSDARGRTQWVSNLWSTQAEKAHGLRRMTEGIYVDRDPVWSPTGHYLYFASNRAGRSSIWRFSTGGAGGLGMVTSSSTSDSAPDLSPHGLVLLYSVRIFPSEVPQIWTLSLDGGLPTQLRPGDHARWSPDGTTIVFSAEDQAIGRSKIWQMAANGSNPVQLTHSIACDDVHPSYSPDASRIVFASNRGQSTLGLPNYDIWIMDADGSNPLQLTTNGSHDDLPEFGPTGGTIYFRSNRGGKWDVWELEMDRAGGPRY